MTVDVLAPRDVRTTLNYYRPLKDSEPPYYYTRMDPPAGLPQTNVTNAPYSAVIHDARGKDGLNLDASGFQWVTYPSVEKEFVDEEQIKTVYYPEVEDVLKKHAGAKRVFIFDHTIRRNQRARSEPNKEAVQGPVHLVHADQTPAAAEYRVRSHLPDDAERLLKGRYQIINVWRPIANPVAHYPLGVADFRTVDLDTDLVSTRLISPEREGATFSVKHNPGHRWYYLSDQTPDEVTLIKCFDSDTSKALLTPHSAFLDESSPADAPHRQSIEVRALVFDRE